MDNIYDDEIVKMVDGLLKTTFKEEIKKNNENRISIIKNLDIYKRVKNTYSGKGLLGKEIIAHEALLYPLMPWENGVKKAYLTEEEASALYFMSILVMAHSAISVRGATSVWFNEQDVEDGRSDFVSEVLGTVNDMTQDFQLFISQSIVEMDKYIYELISAQDSKKALENNKAILNVCSTQELQRYVSSKHTSIHNKIKEMKSIEIEGGYERETKITIYKGLSAILREYLIYSKFLKELTIAWNQHKYFYGYLDSVKDN